MNILKTFQLRIAIAAVLLAVSVCTMASEKQADELTGEDRKQFDKFRFLLSSGSPEEFYAFASEYEKVLLEKKYMMLYYKLKHNEGFFALRHNQIFKAMMYAEQLDEEMRSAGANRYFYLATGLYGDIYKSSHDIHRAETYFMQALEEVGDEDSKFVIRIYMHMAEMFSYRDSKKALMWADKAITSAQDNKNFEYLSLALGMKGYVLFLVNDASQFMQVYDEYMALKRSEEAEFNHRYDQIMDVGKLAFDHDYEKALMLIHQGNLSVDSSLCVVHVYGMKEDITNGFKAMKDRFQELDSIYSLMQDANFNQLASETTLMRSQEEARMNKEKVNTLVNWLIGIVACFLFIYLMGRRRLMKKIWARSKELKIALQRAEESDRMKMAFIQNMSHEIRTPLNAVAGFSELLCSPSYELSMKEKEDMQQRISSNVDLITTIVNELLELSKSETESQNTVVEKTDVKCNELCHTVLMANKIHAKQFVEMRFHTKVDDAFTIHTNAYRLRSALSHLIDNALKFTDMGHIDLTCELQGNNVVFTVMDTGIGIEEKDRERIFENFQKLDEFKEGIGLGLPICRKLVTSLGGTVELNPDYGPGSCFVITIPKQ